MKINCFPKILFGIYILLFCKLSFAFDETVAAKYNDIFTQNILSQEILQIIASLIISKRHVNGKVPINIF